MSVHERQKPPTGHGELLSEPAPEQWAALAAANAADAHTWASPLRELREAARAETLDAARGYTSALGLTVPPARDGLLIVTGHQPELYHPGVWVKDFLIQRVAEDVGGTGLDLVVDTDASDGITLRMPCLGDEVRVCEVPLVRASSAQAFVQMPLPDVDARQRFRAAGLESLSILPAPALARHFAMFCDALDAAAATAGDVGALMTGARRRFETPAQTDYLELAVSTQIQTASYRRFAAMLLLDAVRFRASMNRALGEYRAKTGTRSVAQPFPDLAEIDGCAEAPFWLLADGARLAVSVDEAGGLYAGDRMVASLGQTIEAASETIEREGLLLAPRAIALTLFERLFVADVFVHGTGGGRYDRVTDAVIADYFAVRPPAFAVASMTLLLPLGAHIVTDDEVKALEQRLHRLEHNPDDLLGEVEFDTLAERNEAERLAGAKRELVAAISAPGADRKSLGAGIRDANAALASLMQPLAAELRAALEQARAERDASAVLTDRTYPYCLWDPREVMDKVR